jgi:hypothetical protein
VNASTSFPHRRFFIAAGAALLFAALLFSVAWAGLGTLHWPLVGDAPTIHYTTFLFDRGMEPYSQVIEMDQPGAYAVDWTARHAFGEGALAWRLADFYIVAFCWMAMIAIASCSADERWRWLPGFWAGALFALLHFRDGPTHTGQRDLMMTAALLPAVFFLLNALVKPRLWQLFCAGLFLGAASTIKPSGALFALILGALVLWHLHRAGRRVLMPAVVLADGFVLPMLAMALWLHHHHAFRAYLETLRGLDAYHASLGRESLGRLIIGSFPNTMLAIALPAAVLFFTKKPWHNAYAQLLSAATLLGCASYVMQGKGFPYHRYPTEAFLLLLIASTIFPLARASGWQGWLALATIAVGAFFLAPVSAHIATTFDQRTEFNDQLAADLRSLSGNNIADLQYRVQCFDNTAGCVDTLYNLQLVQATGYIYDCYNFQAAPSAFQDEYRHRMMGVLESTQPEVLIFSDQECFTLNRRFTRIDTWPQFAAWLAADYTLTRQYTPPHLVGWWRKPAVPFSYRIYTRREAGSNEGEP